MSFVIFDTEYTSWKGCQEKGWHGSQKKEIVQIAALRVSEDLDVLEEFNQLCCPVINPVLSDYFINLTHITNEMVAREGVIFAEAFDHFKRFAGQDICFSHGWGADFIHKSDGAIIDENIALYHLTQENDLAYLNIAPIFQELYQKYHIDIKSQASGQIAALLNIEDQLKSLDVGKHNALYDVYSILVGLRYFKTEALFLIEEKLRCLV